MDMEAADPALTEAAPVADGGDRPTLSTLYERHVGRAIALATLLTGDAHAAEDIAHDCFVRVAARTGLFDREQVRFEAYLQRAVVNTCRSRFRRRSVERSFLARERIIATSPPPELAIDRSVAAALRALPYRQRAGVALRYLEDLSEEQTAQVLRCSPRAVNALVSRAIATLRERIEPEEET
jgi:RNA polymerase sigma factor (sigma-70 family)